MQRRMPHEIRSDELNASIDKNIRTIEVLIWIGFILGGIGIGISVFGIMLGIIAMITSSG